MRAGGPRTQEALYLPYSRLEERWGNHKSCPDGSLTAGLETTRRAR